MAEGAVGAVGVDAAAAVAETGAEPRKGQETPSSDDGCAAQRSLRWAASRNPHGKFNIKNTILSRVEVRMVFLTHPDPLSISISSHFSSRW
jgi:hypothetical protein